MKKLLKSSDYYFNAANQTVAFRGEFAVLELSQIQLITNVTDSVVIYQFNAPVKGASSMADGLLTLAHDTTAMSDSDELMIIVEVENEVESATHDTQVNDTLKEILGELREMKEKLMQVL